MLSKWCSIINWRPSIDAERKLEKSANSPVAISLRRVVRGICAATVSAATPSRAVAPAARALLPSSLRAAMNSGMNVPIIANTSVSGSLSSVPMSSSL
jgi:hypothetical protein